VRAATAPGIEGDTIQLGTGVAVSIRELFDTACRALGVTATVEEDPRRLRPDGSEVMVLLSDPARANARLGWTPRTTLEEGLRRTATWLGTNLDKYRSDFHV